MKIWYLLRAWNCGRRGHPYPFINVDPDGSDPAWSWCSHCATMKEL